jgi:chemotaxis protein methyltransferase WspC
MDTSLNTIKQLLKREIGLDAATVGEATIKKILDQRMRACKLHNLDDYSKLLITDKSELTALLETAVIPETWFFRDIRPFSIILDCIRNNQAKYAINPCNILSLPCSTGEEPYSIAMYLLQESIPANHFRIKAIDISRQSLDIAEQGYYGNNSFRGLTAPNYIDRFFTHQNGQYVVNNNVRQCITFERVNVLDASSLPYTNYFDFILCRNLLIYFDISTKMVAFNNLHNILKDDGVLFIGHSEFGAVPRDLFSNTGSDKAFGLIKFTPAPDKVTTPPFIPSPIRSSPTPSKKSPKKKTPPAVDTPVSPEISPPAGNTQDQPECVQDYLHRAQQLADEGKMHDAEEYCLRHIEKNGGQCESFFLMALINESAGKYKMAEDFYRKAIYLNPKHYHSLIHLALLLENMGDKKSAILLKQRAERALNN